MVKGFITNPTAQRVVPQVRRLPVLVRVGSTEPCLLFVFGDQVEDRSWKAANEGEAAMYDRTCVRDVMYNATPGTLLKMHI